MHTFEVVTRHSSQKEKSKRSTVTTYGVYDYDIYSTTGNSDSKLRLTPTRTHAWILVVQDKPALPSTEVVVLFSNEVTTRQATYPSRLTTTLTLQTYTYVRTQGEETARELSHAHRT